MAFPQRRSSSIRRSLAAFSRSAMRRSSSASSFSYCRRRRASWMERLFRSRRYERKNLRFDHGLADGFVLFIRKLGGQFAAADGVDSGLEQGNAFEPPERIGEGLGEALFF